MPPESVSERLLREAREARESLEAREAIRVRAAALTIEEERIRQARENRGTTQESGQAMAMGPWHQPQLVLNRATALLACICLLRLHQPYWNDQFIANFLRSSFPDIRFDARDVNTLFLATCRNRPYWVHNMRHVEDDHERAIADGMLEVLEARFLAHLPQLPPVNYRDPRDGIRYLHDLLGVPIGDRI